MMVDLATHNPVVAGKDLLGGVHHRRIDAILDWYDIEFSAGDVQGYLGMCAEDLHEARKSGARKTAEFGGLFAGGFVGGMFGGAGHAFTGAAVRQGTQWFYSMPGKIDESLLQAARLLTASVALDEEHVEAIRTVLRARMLTLSGEAARRKSARVSGGGIWADSEESAAAKEFRLLKAVMERLPGEAKGSSRVVDAPDVVGRRLDQAKAVLTAHGFSVTAQDALGEGRIPLIESNWEVVGQGNAIGDAVPLEVKKFAEYVPVRPPQSSGPMFKMPQDTSPLPDEFTEGLGARFLVTHLDDASARGTWRLLWDKHHCVALEDPSGVLHPAVIATNGLIGDQGFFTVRPDGDCLPFVSVFAVSSSADGLRVRSVSFA